MDDTGGPGGTGGTLRWHGALLADQQLRHRPVSAPARRRKPLPGSSSSMGATKGKNRRQQLQQQQQQQQRRRPETASGSGRSGEGRGGTGCWGSGRSGGGGKLHGLEQFECLKARLAKTVEGSSNFVDDVRRLRKAGGLRYCNDGNAGSADAWSGIARRGRGGAASGGQAPPLLRGGGGGSAGAIAEKGAKSAAFAPAPVCSAGGVEPLALAKELGVQSIVDRMTRAIIQDGRAAGECGGIDGRSGAAGGSRAGAGGRGHGHRAIAASPGLTTVTNTGVRGDHNGDQYRPQLSPPPPANQRRQPQRAIPDKPWGSGAIGSSPSSRPPGSSSMRMGRPKKDIERLRRVVRDTMSSPQLSPPSSSSLSLYGGIGLAGGEHFGTQPPQWSQKHEACLADMRRRLRETGSPLLGAKDPAVLLGALLRRQRALIRLLDEAVLSLEDTAEALNGLVSVSTRLMIAGVSADALFTRAGIVKPGAAGSLGHAAAGAEDGRNATTTTTTKRTAGGGEASKVRRCTIKRIHVEIHRVLGEAASFREFRTALSACVRGGDGDGGGGRGASGGGSSGGAGIEWITVDQLDHALRTCHLTRRALDPQGASHPPLTGKRVARFIEEMERSLSKPRPPVPPTFATATVAGASPNAVDMLLLGNQPSQSLTGGASKRAKQTRRQGRRAKMARKRAGKWNDDDRDLAERELAAVVVERQKMFVEGYVRERRRYLSRRVSAQREGHGGFQREKVPGGASGRLTNKVTDAEKAEFSEAVARTKIVLKLLETKAAAPSLTQPNGGGGGGGASESFPSSTSNNNNTGLEAKHHSVGARNSRADDQDDCRRPASAAPLVATTTTTTTTTNINNNSTGLPKMKQEGADKRASTDDGKGVKRNMKQVLRTSTEAYSDRVGQHGGGAARLQSRNNNSRAAAGGGAPGGVPAGGGGERARLFAAAQTVQVAFRQRMFHRFVWAQAYLRSPTHAFGFFKRCLTVLRGADAAKAAAVSGAAAAPAGALLATRPAGVPMDVTSIDTWPESPSFCLSLPHHVHAADPVFLRYVRWRRNESSSGGYLGEGVGTASATEPVPTAAAVGSPRLLTSASESTQLQQHQPPPPEGAQLFEKKHPVRSAAVRSMLVDLRVPFLPGALDSAMEDLERTIAREGTGDVSAVVGSSKNSHGGGGGGGSGARDVTGAVTRPNPSTNGSGKAGRGRLGQHGVGISFAGWYGWWVRHLPFDPASTGCLLKTVRCAKALHVAEISAAAGNM